MIHTHDAKTHIFDQQGLIEGLVATLFSLSPDEGDEVGEEYDQQQDPQDPAHHRWDDDLLQLNEVLPHTAGIRQMTERYDHLV